jgi:hypothetical protein
MGPPPEEVLRATTTAKIGCVGKTIQEPRRAGGLDQVDNNKLNLKK